MEKTVNRLLMQAFIFICISVHCINCIAAPVFPDRLELLGLLENRKFDDLETLFQSFQRDYEEGSGDERLIDFALETLANSNPNHEAIINAWTAAHPDSFVPILVRAYYYYGVAWSWRGHRSKKETPTDRLVRMKEYLELAASDITQAIQIKPRLTAADALAIKVLMLLGSEEYKKQTVKEALEISPDSYLVRSSYLWSMKSKWGRRPEELMGFIKDIEGKTKGYPQLKPLLGYADYIFAEGLTGQKRFEEADIHFDFAIDKGSDHIIYRDRGINYYQLGRYELALQDFNYSLELWPQNPKVLRWRAHTFQRLKQMSDAKLDLDLAVRMVPTERYVLMAHAFLSRKMKRYDQVSKFYENALFYNSNDADIWFERGMHYSHELMNFEAAERDLKRATELAPENATYWYEYAAVLHYNLNCEIIVPLEHYLKLCETGSPCRPGELEWADHAKEWLKENERCTADAQLLN